MKSQAGAPVKGAHGWISRVLREAVGVGRPPKFSRAQVQREALAIVDRVGLAELSMRTVAKALGTGPMTLYGHVQDRADLEALVVDAIFAEIVLPPSAPSWQTSVEDIAVAVWSKIRQHPHAVSLVLARRGQSDAALSIGEALVHALKGSGLGKADLVVAFRTILAVIVGGVEADPVDENETRFGSSFDHLFEADPSAHPQLRLLVDVAERMTPEEIFRSTVRTVLAGIEHAAT